MKKHVRPSRFGHLLDPRVYRHEDTIIYKDIYIDILIAEDGTRSVSYHTYLPGHVEVRDMLEIKPRGEQTK